MTATRRPELDGAATQRRWSLVAEADVVQRGDGLAVRVASRTILVPEASEVVRQALDRMSLGPVTLENVPLLQAAAQRWREGDVGGPCHDWVQVREALVLLHPVVRPHLVRASDGARLLSAVPRPDGEPFDHSYRHAPDHPRLVPGVRLTEEGAEVWLVGGASFHVRLHLPAAQSLLDRLLGGRSDAPPPRPTTPAARHVLDQMLTFLAAVGLVVGT